METILLVEDDAALSEGIALVFSQQPYEFVRCATLAEARRALQTRMFSLILLDLGLPDGNGLELCRQLRDRRDPVPVLFLTANDTEYSEVAALEAGGDDYITKPFSLAVLRARVTAALRRRVPAGPELVEIGLQGDEDTVIVALAPEDGLCVAYRDPDWCYTIREGEELTAAVEALLPA